MSDTIEIMNDAASLDNYLPAELGLEGQKVTQQQFLVHAQSVITSVDFFLLVLLAPLVCVVASQAWTITANFYKFYARIAWMREWGVRLFAALNDIMMSASIIYYLWNAMGPADGSETDWYVSIFAVWTIAQIFKWFTSIMFWEYGWSTVAVGFGFFGMLATEITVIALTVLFGIRQIWPSFALSLVVSILYALAVIFAGYVFWYVFQNGGAGRRSRSVPLSRDLSLIDVASGNMRKRLGKVMG
jgi:hypothetical protein